VLTKLSTLGLCVAENRLASVCGDLLDADEEQRVWIYGNHEFRAWYRNELPNLSALPGSELSPLEEVESFFRVLMLKKRASGQLARLMPTKAGVWEIKPHQVRMFGWFVMPLHLVLVGGASVVDIKGAEHDGYEPFRQNVIKVRKELGLGYVAGDITRVLKTI
jgi:hypothetical protein